MLYSVETRIWHVASLEWHLQLTDLQFRAQSDYDLKNTVIMPLLTRLPVGNALLQSLAPPVRGPSYRSAKDRARRASQLERCATWFQDCLSSSDWSCFLYHFKQQPEWNEGLFEIISTEAYGDRQFDVVAISDISAHTMLENLAIYALHIPNAKNDQDVEREGLALQSVFADEKGYHLGLGRGRLINHDCLPNMEWQDIDTPSWDGIKMVPQTNRDVVAGESLTVFYSSAYFVAGAVAAAIQVFVR
ncbi:hypothetical protein IAU60_006894 [Kwoniella sp. DSM 27419]